MNITNVVKNNFTSLSTIKQKQVIYFTAFTTYTFIILRSALCSEYGLLHRILAVLLLLIVSALNIKFVILSPPTTFLSKIQHNLLFLILLSLPSMLRISQTQVYRCCLYSISVLFRRRPSEITWIILEIFHYFPM